MYLFLVKRAADDAGLEIEKKKPRLEVSRSNCSLKLQCSLVMHYFLL